MALVWTVLGLVLIAVAVRDSFATLLQPNKTGGLNRAISLTIFRVLRAIGRRLQRRRSDERAVLVLAGPLAVLLVILSWAVLIASGAALIYMPHMPEEFVLASGLPAAEDGFSDALYFSLSNLTTLGIGDFAPRTGWLRVVTGGQALTGVALITAAVSWLLVIYPAIARKRALAQMVSVYLAAADGSWETMLQRSPARAAAFLAEVTARLATMRADLTQFPVIYEFEVRDPRVTLPSVLLDLAALVDITEREDCPMEVRVEARVLDEALGVYAATLRHLVLGGEEGTRATLDRYAEEHLVGPEAGHCNEVAGGPGT